MYLLLAHWVIETNSCEIVKFSVKISYWHTKIKYTQSQSWLNNISSMNNWQWKKKQTCGVYTEYHALGFHFHTAVGSFIHVSTILQMSLVRLVFLRSIVVICTGRVDVRVTHIAVCRVNFRADRVLSRTSANNWLINNLKNIFQFQSCFSNMFCEMKRGVDVVENVEAWKKKI